MLSIICPSFNVEGCIRTLIESIINQTANNYEIIIVDGASTDNTVSIIEEYGDLVKCISEKDDGIYDAMNKGIDLAYGEWLYFIGADDSLYSPKAIQEVMPHLENSEADVILCKINSSEYGIIDSEISRKLAFKNVVNHQGALYRKRVFDNYRYILDYSLLADYDLNCYVLKKCFKVENIDVVFANHSFEGASGQANFRSYKEEIQIRKKYFKSVFINCIGYFYTILRFLYRKLKLALRR